MYSFISLQVLKMLREKLFLQTRITGLADLIIILDKEIMARTMDL